MSLHTEWLRRTGTDLRGFWSSEDGLVTVEWVALAGAIIIGAIAVGWLVMRSLSAPANAIGSQIQAKTSSTL
jgi:Flp pilus assembly pilin Flp